MPGALTAAVAFVLPAFLLMVGLSAAYFALGELALVKAFFRGLFAIVVATNLNACVSLRRTTLSGWQRPLLAAMAFAALPLRVTLPVVLLGSALLAPVLWRNDRAAGSETATPRFVSHCHRPGSPLRPHQALPPCSIMVQGILSGVLGDAGLRRPPLRVRGVVRLADLDHHGHRLERALAESELALGVRGGGRAVAPALLSLPAAKGRRVRTKDPPWA